MEFWIYDKLLFSKAQRVKGDWCQKIDANFYTFRHRVRSGEEWAKCLSEFSKYHLRHLGYRDILVPGRWCAGYARIFQMIKTETTRVKNRLYVGQLITTCERRKLLLSNRQFTNTGFENIVRLYQKFTFARKCQLRHLYKPN